MAVLAVPVLLGFQFRVVLERRFDALPHLVQLGHIGGVGLLLATSSLAVSPRLSIASRKIAADTPRERRFTARMVGLVKNPSCDWPHRLAARGLRCRRDRRGFAVGESTSTRDDVARTARLARRATRALIA